MPDNKYPSSVLLYHIYLIGSWRDISRELLKNVPHDAIYINISVDWRGLFSLIRACLFFSGYTKVRKIYITINRKAFPEVEGFNKLRANIPWDKYELMTYMHGKGVTKPGNKNIKDWVEMMRYFIMDRMDLCHAAFDKGYKLYGVNLCIADKNIHDQGPHLLSGFHYSGNFVSVNLNGLRDKLTDTPIDNSYFGLEGFWGKLCQPSEAFSAHLSMVDHYSTAYPGNLYI